MLKYKNSLLSNFIKRNANTNNSRITEIQTIKKNDADHRKNIATIVFLWQYNVQNVH